MADTLGISAGLAEMANELGTTLTWGAQSITVVAGTTNQTDDVEDGGTFQRRGIEVMAVVSDFTKSTLPALHTVVGVGSINYQIEEIDLDENKTVARLALDRI